MQTKIALTLIIITQINHNMVTLYSVAWTFWTISNFTIWAFIYENCCWHIVFGWETQVKGENALRQLTAAGYKSIGS